MAAYLMPGSVVTEAGIYRVSHSNGHMPDAESHLITGLILPSCRHDGCHVSYSLMRNAPPICEDDDFKD